MSAPACLQFCHAPRDERCVDCDELLVVTGYTTSRRTGAHCAVVRVWRAPWAVAASGAVA